MFTRDGQDVSDTWFCKALRWRVHDSEEALFIAATHRRKAAELRDRGLAAPHDEMVHICEQHAANLVREAAALSVPGQGDE